MAAQVKASTDFELGRAVFLHLKSLPELSADDLSVESDGEKDAARHSDQIRQMLVNDGDWYSVPDL
jgi:hypothetical protein